MLQTFTLSVAMWKLLAATSCLAVACQASKPEPSLPIRDPEPNKRSTTAVEVSERAEGDASAPEPVTPALFEALIREAFKPVLERARTSDAPLDELMAQTSPHDATLRQLAAQAAHTLGTTPEAVAEFEQNNPDIARETSRRVALELAAELEDIAKRRNKVGFEFTDIDDALRAAKKDPKPILLYVRAHWSTAALEFEHRVLSMADVRNKLLTSFHSVYVDVTNFDDPANSEISQRFKIEVIPTVLVLDTQGIERERLSDHIDLETFSSTLSIAP